MESNNAVLGENIVFEEVIKVEESYAKLMESLTILKSKYYTINNVEASDIPQDLKQPIIQKDEEKFIDNLPPKEEKKEEKNSNSTNCNDSEEELENKFSGTLFIYPNELDFSRVYKGSQLEKEINIYNFTEKKLELEIFIEGSYVIMDNKEEIKTSKIVVDKSEGKEIIIRVDTKELEDNVEEIGYAWILSEEGDYKINLKALHCIPYISCPRMLSFMSQQTDIIKLASKRSARSELRIRLKNHQDYPLAVDLELFSPNSKGKRDGIFLNSMVRTFPPNGIAFPSIIVKKNSTTEKEIKRLLIVKIRNSSIYYTFPIIIELF